jgi:hypothetical protein
MLIFRRIKGGQEGRMLAVGWVWLASSALTPANSRRVHLERAACAALPAFLSPLLAVPARAADAQRGGATSAATALVTDRVALTFSEQFSPEEKRE